MQSVIVGSGERRCHRFNVYGNTYITEPGLRNEIMQETGNTDCAAYLDTRNDDEIRWKF